MLTALRIKNLALVDDLTLDLGAGYHVITGETGAGKSILIGALELVLGERADRTLIRGGCDSCTVEAAFDIGKLTRSRRCQSAETVPRGSSRGLTSAATSELETFLADNGLEPCEGAQLVLKRAFTANGANRQFINGSPTTLAALKHVGEWLVDIHGPHDHQSLLHPARQLAMLDAFGGLEKPRAEFGELTRRRAALETEKAALIVDEQTYARQLDLLRFQVQEIAAANLRPDEEEEVAQSHQRASNAAKLLQLSQTALDLLSENEHSLLTQAGSVGRALQELQRMDAAAAPLAGLQEQAAAALSELQSALSQYADKLDLDPGRMQELEERLNLLQSLKRKYGASLAEVMAFGDEARRKLQSLEQRDAELARLNGALQQADRDLRRAGQQLSAHRRKVIPPLSQAVSRQLADLGFKQSKFDIALTTPDAADSASRHTPHGFDTVEFQFAPNPGEPAKPLRAIASSGELARVMLALKTVLAAEDDIPVLIFDEVDANIGGETANAVGEKMKQLAANRQVLCITHLPQVAAPAAAHYLVSKRMKGGRTVSGIELLARQERVTELARMLGGQTDVARKHAEALLR